MCGAYRGRLLTLATSALLFACGGGNHPVSPTAPTTVATPSVTPTVPTTIAPIPTAPAANQWQVVMFISIAAEEFLSSSILGADFLLNGTLEQRRSYSPASFNSGFTTLKFLSAGRYTVTARITAQVVNPTRYELTGFAEFTRGVQSISFECPRQRQSLMTGGELSCTFSLP